ncbi:GDSL-type esterase/lipase family protein [Olsenella sp. HMSC062G07]|uniref:GDSL-type esterase/lipase family protein n=1 Tax=Olsenella sp. HMSC062G07 TaxID=1739330 RepID=UPI000AAEA405|nr:GDSL-type esterase/lipase family protein [Olsenella sp. HMSC062G07]
MRESAAIDAAARRDLSGMTCVAARSLLHGCVSVEEGADGWLWPLRFSASQLRALGSVRAWHPGLYRAMARTTAGICLEFVTDASQMSLELAPDGEPPATRAVLDYVPKRPGEPAPSSHDGIAVEVDGGPADLLPLTRQRSTVDFWVQGRQESADGAVQLPGLGRTHQVRVWLPCLRGCQIRALRGNGTLIEPVAARRQLLVLGDSIAQGFVCDDPSRSWPVLLARELGLDVVNQGLGGQVFQPGSLFGLKAGVDVACIVVALGANYRYEPCDARRVMRDVQLYLDELSRLWPDVLCLVADPLWHDEGRWPSHPRSCWREVPRLIATQVARHGQMRHVEGSRLIDHRSSLMADGFEHPNAEGSRQIARRLSLVFATQRTDEPSRRRRAAALMKDAPRRCLPLAQMIQRSLATIELAERGCVVARTPDGIQTIWADDAQLGRDALAMVVDAPLAVLLEPCLVRDAGLVAGLTDVAPFHLCSYERTRALTPPRGLEVRPLDESHLPKVLAGYAHPEYTSEAALRALLGEGRILGGFADGVLTGFIGEHPCGSLGMLEVFVPFRRRGWARALLCAKINEQLAKGWVPWAEVYPDNAASLALVRSLGLRVLPANETCYVSRLS